MSQSAGMTVWLLVSIIWACITDVAAFCVAVSTAMVFPAQPRKDSKTSIREINKKRIKRRMCK
jgi:hypothetical protein